jgi:xylulokinase
MMYAGIDCGTQGTKVVIYDADSHQVLSQGYAEHELVSDDSGTREQHPDWWTGALIDAFSQALATPHIDAAAIAALGVSGQQHGLVVLDEKDQVIRPAKLWCDTSTYRQTEQLVTALGGKSAVIDEIGLTILTGYTASKLLWLKQHEPENFSRIRSILLPHDYLNFWLTGEKTAEYGDASGSGFFDIRKRCWSEQVLQQIDDSDLLLSALPRLLTADEAAGHLTDKAARVLGLKPGILVSSGGGDNMMGAIGTGNVSPGHITMSLGTSGTLYAYMQEPCIDQQGLVAAFCSSNNAWLPLICTMNVTNVTSGFQGLLGYDHDRFNHALQQTSVGADGLTLTPFLNGERTPDLPAARGSLLGIDSTNLTPDNLCRAAVEGVSFGLRYGLELFENSGLDAKRIRLIGGGSKSSAWRQIIADMMNAIVEVPMEPEAAALGAALQAQWCHSRVNGENTALGEICSEGVKLDAGLQCEPDSRNAERYREFYQRYLESRHMVYHI